MTIITTSTQQLIEEINQKSNDHNFNALKNNDIKPYIKAIESELKKLKNIASNNFEDLNNSNALKMLSHVQSAQTTAQLLATYILAISSQSAINQVVNNVSNWVTGTLIPWLKNLGSSIWAVIQNLTTPTEWKIKGGLGSSAFGLANAELEITFG